MKPELIIGALVLGALIAVIFLTKMDLLAEIITLALKTVFKFVLMIASAIFELVKAVFKVFIDILEKIIGIFFKTTPPPDNNDKDGNDNSTNS